MFCVLDLFGDVPGVHIVQDVLERSDFIVAFQRVHFISEGDVSYALGLEEYLRIVAGHDVVPAQTGKILGDDQIYSSPFYIFQKFPEPRSIEIQTGVTVVHIYFVYLEVVLGAVVRQDAALGGDTDAFSGLFIILGQPAVQPRPIVGCFLHCNPSFFLVLQCNYTPTG